MLCKNIPSSQVLLLYKMAYHLPVCIDDGNYNSIISMFHTCISLTKIHDIFVMYLSL